MRAPALLRRPALISSLRLGSPHYLSFTTFLIFTPHLLLPLRASSAAFGGLPLHRCPFFTEIGCPLLPLPPSFPPSLAASLSASLSLSLSFALCVKGLQVALAGWVSIQGKLGKSSLQWNKWEQIDLLSLVFLRERFRQKELKTGPKTKRG